MLFLKQKLAFFIQNDNIYNDSFSKQNKGQK